MNSEHPEYNRDTNPYPSFGKKYNSERAIISLTSWKARINTVSKTLFSLIQQCPGFHIVLVLSEEEFPKMMDELPENLKLFVDNELIEILWVFRNYKSFKKWIFTADKYTNVPIITADDGCIYVRNYAEELYNYSIKYKNCIISYNKFENEHILFGGSGSGICFTPNMSYLYKNMPEKIIETYHDDFYYGYVAKRNKINWIFLNRIPNENNFINFDKNGISNTIKPNKYISKMILLLNQT